MKEFNLTFDGYWAKESIAGMPSYNGIYCVYVGTPTSNNRVRLRKLIYIGKANRSGGVKDRLLTHEKMRDFEKEAGRGEAIYFSCAPVRTSNGGMGTGEDILRAESALIYTQEPPLNTDSRDSFNYPDTIVNVSGKNACMEDGIWEGNNGEITINIK